MQDIHSPVLGVDSCNQSWRARRTPRPSVRSSLPPKNHPRVSHSAASLMPEGPSCFASPQSQSSGPPLRVRRHGRVTTRTSRGMYRHPCDQEKQSLCVALSVRANSQCIEIGPHHQISCAPLVAELNAPNTWPSMSAFFPSRSDMLQPHFPNSRPAARSCTTPPCPPA